MRCFLFGSNLRIATMIILSLASSQVNAERLQPGSQLEGKHYYISGKDPNLTKYKTIDQAKNGVGQAMAASNNATSFTYDNIPFNSTQLLIDYNQTGVIIPPPLPTIRFIDTTHYFVFLFNSPSSDYHWLSVDSSQGTKDFGSADGSDPCQQESYGSLQAYSQQDAPYVLVAQSGGFEGHCTENGGTPNGVFTNEQFTASGTIIKARSCPGPLSAYTQESSPSTLRAGWYQALARSKLAPYTTYDFGPHSGVNQSGIDGPPGAWIAEAGGDWVCSGAPSAFIDTAIGHYFAQCPVAALNPITSDATAEENSNGNSVNTTGMSSAAQTGLSCMQSAITNAGGTSQVTSGYRSPDYQSHLQDLWDKKLLINDQHGDECSDLKADIKKEDDKHRIIRRPVDNSKHTKGTAFDLSFNVPAGNDIDKIAGDCGMSRPEPVTDHVHFATK